MAEIVFVAPVLNYAQTREDNPYGSPSEPVDNWVGNFMAPTYRKTKLIDDFHIYDPMSSALSWRHMGADNHTGYQLLYTSKTEFDQAFWSADEAEAFIKENLKDTVYIQIASHSYTTSPSFNNTSNDTWRIHLSTDDYPVLQARLSQPKRFKIVVPRIVSGQVEYLRRWLAESVGDDRGLYQVGKFSGSSWIKNDTTFWIQNNVVAVEFKLRFLPSDDIPSA